MRTTLTITMPLDLAMKLDKEENRSKLISDLLYDYYKKKEQQDIKVI